ncbi:MAG: DUF366 family protein [Bdellovibrionales bacterium]
MKTLWIDQKNIYDGSQLRSLYAYMEHSLLGDSAIAWRGPCQVTDHMVDGEDKKANAEIRGGDMIHFIVELFDSQLFAAVGIQRLLASLVKDQIVTLQPRLAEKIYRDGDDIYLRGTTLKKFSISIATQSPVSSLIHFAINVSNDGTPVPTCSLQDFEIEPTVFAKSVLEQFAREMSSVRDATRKVFWVK